MVLNQKRAKKKHAQVTGQHSSNNPQTGSPHSNFPRAPPAPCRAGGKTSDSLQLASPLSHLLAPSAMATAAKDYCWLAKMELYIVINPGRGTV